MSTWKRPEWLAQALTEKEVRPVPGPDEIGAPIKVASGEIRAAQAMDGERGARLVLIVSVSEAHDWANALLLSNVVEVATSKDVRFDPGETGLTFPVLVETDIVGPMFVVQFGPRLGQVDSEILAQLQVVQRGDDLVVFADRRGLPVRSRRENRVRWKEQELQAMHDLAGECFTELMLKEQAEPPVLVDDALFDLEDSDLPNALGHLTRLNELGHLEVPAEALLTEEGNLRPWLAELGPQYMTALEHLWREALRATPAPSSTESLDTEWQPNRRESGQSVLERYVSGRVAQGERSVRLATRTADWEIPHPSDMKSGVVRLKLGNKGMVQISPELVEEAA